MEPDHIRFGGGATATLLHPVVAVWMLIAIVMILTVQRKNAIVPFLLSVLTIPIGQVVLVGGVHFTMMRILILVGLVRAACSKASSSGRWFATGFNPIDQVVVLWTVSAFIVISIQWMNAPMLIASLGNFLDALGGYLVVRSFIDDGEALRRTIKVFAVICAIHGVCMINEQITGVNVFNLIGGVNTPVETTIRDGQLRSSGVMGPLGEGVFAGVLMPLFLWLWTEGKSRMAAYTGLAGATAMLITTHASTPWMSVGAGLLGLSFWPLRKRMRIIRWGLVFMLVALHLVMKAPVWHLISRVDLTGSSSSYHRYTLVNQTIRHFSDWWLLGYKYYDHWDWDMWDTSNLFVAAALTGGLVTLVLVIAVFSRSFGAIGTARKRVSGDRRREWLLWCLGSALFACIVSCFGIAFLYQSQMLLFALPAFISVATFEARQVTIRKVEELAVVGVGFASGNAGSGLPLSEGRQETDRPPYDPERFTNTMGRRIRRQVIL
jgi:hypothetical protein